ncbi:hypothetical protein ABTK75_19845, partial [Acinetobacter baumannii]
GGIPLSRRHRDLRFHTYATLDGHPMPVHVCATAPFTPSAGPRRQQPDRSVCHTSLQLASHRLRRISC